MPVVLSIEGSSVKVLEASRKGRGFVIHKALTIPTDGLDTFLSSTKHRDFIVAIDFSELTQELLNLPPVKGKDLQRLVEAEMRRIYPNFYYTFSDLGEKVIENKRTRIISVLRTPRKEIDEIVEKFLLHGKNVTAIFDAPSCVASLIKVSPKPLLCLFETEDKNIFLVKDGIILFTRKLTSFEKGLTSLDIQGIEMSITHCIQNLRIPPEEILLAGNFKDVPSSIGGLRVTVLEIPKDLRYSPSFATPLNGELTGGEDNSLWEYLIPVGGLYPSPSKSLLPPDYRRFRLLRKVLRVNATIFTFLFFIFLVLGLKDFISAQSMREEIRGMLTKHRALARFIESYNRDVAEAKALKSLSDFLINEQGIFISEVLRDISGYPLEGIDLKGIDISRSGNTINVRISGRFSSESHTAMLISFNNLLKAINKKDPEIIRDVVNKRFSMADGSFDIDIQFRLAESLKR